MGLVASVAGPSFEFAGMRHNGRGRVGKVQHIVGELETKENSTGPKCHWIKMEQHDFPERGDKKSVVYANFPDLNEVKRVAEEGGYVGFALHDNIAYMKGGDNAPQSWRDLLWMGLDYKVDFYLCEKSSTWREKQARMQEAVALLNGVVENKTKAVKGQWVRVHALPRNEGSGLIFDNQNEAKTVDDFKILCAAHPDCVGFAHDPAHKTLSAKKKGTGFDSSNATYYHKGSEIWEWYYIQSRSVDPSHKKDLTQAVEAPHGWTQPIAVK